MHIRLSAEVIAQFILEQEKTVEYQPDYMPGGEWEKWLLNTSISFSN